MNDKADVCIASQLVRCPSDSGPGEWTSYTASYSAGSVARGHWSVWCRNSPGFVVFVVVCNIQCLICSGRRIDFLIVCSHCILPYCSVYGFRFTPYIVALFIEASCKKEAHSSVRPTYMSLLFCVRFEHPFPLPLDLSVRSTLWVDHRLLCTLRSRIPCLGIILTSISIYPSVHLCFSNTIDFLNLWKWLCLLKSFLTYIHNRKFFQTICTTKSRV